MGRPSPDAAAVGVRAALAAKLRGTSGIDDAHDPRWVLVPEDRWPSPMPHYEHPARAWLAALEAGEPVDVWPFLLRGIADVPPGCRRARVEVDGTVSPAEYERVGRL